jgi:antitoxin (DNA-binding transcriptional repressor) of toxin-antitoxin stability system
MPYTIHQAKTQLSRLVKEAEAGKEVVLMRGKKPVARISAIEPPEKKEVPFRLLGAYRDKISWSDDAFAPLADRELREMGMDYLADAPLIPIPAKPAEER